MRPRSDTMIPDSQRPATTHDSPASASSDAGPSTDIPADALFGSLTTAQVIFVGPVGVGKSTAVRALSSIDVIGTEALMAHGASAFLNVDKRTTTVGIDFGIWNRPDGRAVGLFGTAGQDRFASSRMPLHNPDARVVLLLFGDRGELEADIDYWVRAVGGPEMTKRMIAAVNFPADDSIERTSRALFKAGALGVPILTVDPRNPLDVEHVVTVLLDCTEA